MDSQTERSVGPRPDGLKTGHGGDLVAFDGRSAWGSKMIHGDCWIDKRFLEKTIRTLVYVVDPGHLLNLDELRSNGLPCSVVTLSDHHSKSNVLSSIAQGAVLGAIVQLIGPGASRQIANSKTTSSPHLDTRKQS